MATGARAFLAETEAMVQDAIKHRDSQAGARVCSACWAAPCDHLLAHQFGLESAYARADAYLKAGQAHQPAALFRKVLEHPGILVNSINCPLALLQLVRTQVMMGGDTEAARKSYHDFPTLWKDAAPDTPIL